MVQARGIDRLVAALARVGCEPRRATASSWRSLCPAHDDTTPSLSISVGNEREVVFHCLAGCEPEAVLEALGETWASLATGQGGDEDTMTFVPVAANGNGHARRDVRQAPKLIPALPELGSIDPDPKIGECKALYAYTDEFDVLVYYIARYELWENEKRLSKTFRPFTPVPGGWVQRLPSVRVPYRLPFLLAAIDRGEEVFVVEGEKDVERFAKAGITATCNDGGAGKWNDKHSGWLATARLVSIVRDNDDPGDAHARGVFFSLVREGVCCRVLDPATGKDGSDHLDAGYGIDDFLPSEYRIGDVVSAVESKDIVWLWYRHLPLGTCSVFVGDGGLGKSTVTLDLTARVSSGREWPDGQAGNDPAGVVILNAEDLLEEVVRPRLEAAHADLERIRFLERSFDEKTGEPKPFTFPEDIPMLRAAIRSVNAKLVIIDPIVAYLGDNVDTHNDRSMRRLLLYLFDLARAESCHIVLIQHVPKSINVRKAQHLGMGSAGISNAARIGHLVLENPDDPSGKERLFLLPKCNWEEMPEGLVYRLDRDAFNPAVAGVSWLGTTERSADEALSMTATPLEASGMSGDADSFLYRLLQDEGPLPVQDILKLAQKEGISRSALYRARERLEVSTERQHGGAAVWSLSMSFAHVDRNSDAT